MHKVSHKDRWIKIKTLSLIIPLPGRKQAQLNVTVIGQRMNVRGKEKQ